MGTQGADMRLSTLLALAALVALYVWSQGVNRSPDTRSAPSVGRARAVDGDSLVLNGREMRLQGIDAPEFAQTCRRAGAEYACGREAHQALRALIRQAEVTCSGFERDRFGRLLVTCQAGGVDIAARLVSDGHAVAYGDYMIEEARARNARRGLWAGEFQMPRDWRASHPRGASASPDAPAGVK